MKKRYIAIYSLLIVFSAIMIALFVYSMRGQKLSTKISDWSSFGSFIAPLVSLASMIVLIMTIQGNQKSLDISIKENRNQEERNLVIHSKKKLGQLLLKVFYLLPIIIAREVDYLDLKSQREEKEEIRKKFQLELKPFIDRFIDEYGDEVPDDMENMEDKLSMRSLNNSIHNLNKSITVIESRMEEQDIKIEESLFDMFDKYSEIELLINLYFKNEYGIKISAIVDYTRVMMNDLENTTIKVKDIRTELFSELKNYSINILNNLGDNLNNCLDDGGIQRVLDETVEELDSKYQNFNLNIRDIYSSQNKARLKFRDEKQA